MFYLRLLLFFGAVGLVFWAFWRLVMAYTSQRWPATEGTITCCEVRSIADGGFFVRLRYAYALKTEIFSGSRLSFGRFGGTTVTKAQRTAGRYQVGTTVQVYYAPRHPKLSVLEPGISYEVFGMVGITIAIAALGLLTLFIRL